MTFQESLRAKIIKTSNSEAPAKNMEMLGWISLNTILLHFSMLSLKGMRIWVVIWTSTFNLRKSQAHASLLSTPVLGILEFKNSNYRINTAVTLKLNIQQLHG
ncbi:hypothetical protein VIGAN_01056600 [Vigna angularis var. angularis]|uniref:Uncharacterized protein n=1 Tax=Vigna angularis var. angularis TaxID=157739 RepID=A0A0S3QXT9_PHAAN|nr:hypothetical protein VIGAN_01056600 [Vigna angularis var. angularis]